MSVKEGEISLQKESPNCTIIVNSCDAYSDTWYPFFKIFSKEWPDCRFPIILNTETASYNYGDLNIRCPQLYKNLPAPTWSKRLLDTLNLIDTDYVILLMDDFFLTGKVDSSEIDFIIEEMDSDKSIGVCYVSPMNPIHTVDDKHIDFGGHRGYSERAKTANKCTFIRDFVKPYEKKDLRGLNLVNAQAGVWRKGFLKKTLHPAETAWDWECYGTLRAYRFKEKFISVLPERKIVPYEWSKGNGIMQGVWVPEVVKPLFDRHGIDIDLSIRGIKSSNWNYKYNKQLYKKFLTVLRNIRMLLH